MTAWTDTVKKTFKQGRLSNPSYQFKDALKDAKKYYTKGKEVAFDAVKNKKARVSIFISCSILLTFFLYPSILNKLVNSLFIY